MIGILIFPDFQLLDAAGPIAAFEIAARFANNPPAIRTIAVKAGPVRSSSGVEMLARGFKPSAAITTLIIAGGNGVGTPATCPVTLSFVRRMASRGIRVASVCSGAYVLAEAGLLDGRPATTHWKLAPAFAKQYPKVKLQPEVLYVEDGNVLTSAGTAAGIDCCLHLLRVRYGAETANRAARRMVVAPHRQGGQAQYIEQPVPAAAERDRLAPLLEWLGRHLDRPHDLDDLARRALMSRRNFTRRFRESTGTTVGQWMQNQRLALAQRLLETTDHPVERIATGAGFGSAVSLRKHFVSAFKLSPTAYRQQFSRA